MRISQNKKIHFTSRKQFLRILPVILFAIVGSYFVFQSQAEELLPGDVQCGHNCHRSTNFMKEVITLTGPDTVKVDIYADLSIPELVDIHPLMADLHHQLWYDGADRDDIDPWDEIKPCIDLESQSGKKDVLVHSYTRKTPGDSKNITGSAFHLYFFAVENDRYPNINCATYLSQGGGLKDKRLNYFGLFHGVSLQLGYSPGGNGDGDGSGGNGTGADGNGRGAGGGGGGSSSANTQANQPNTLPSSGAQGDSTQPEITPDPFFDGKEFASGSDTDTLGSTISSTGKKLVKDWYYVVAALVLGGVGGAVCWRWKQKR